MFNLVKKYIQLNQICSAKSKFDSTESTFDNLKKRLVKISFDLAESSLVYIKKVWLSWNKFSLTKIIVYSAKWN